MVHDSKLVLVEYKNQTCLTSSNNKGTNFHYHNSLQSGYLNEHPPSAVQDFSSVVFFSYCVRAQSKTTSVLPQWPFSTVFFIVVTKIHETDDQVSINYTPFSSNMFWIFCCHKLEHDKFWFSNFTSCSSAVPKMKTPSTISPMSNIQSHTHQPPLVRIYMHNLHFVKWKHVYDVFTKWYNVHWLPQVYNDRDN